MKQVFLTNDNRVVVVDVPAPGCSDGEVLVETMASLISTGTEVNVLKSAKNKTWLQSVQSTSQLVMKGMQRLVQDGVARTWRAVESQKALGEAPGYSMAGRVLAVGSGVMDLSPGDLVACGGSGMAAHAEIVSVPVNLVVRIPEGIDAPRAAFTTVGAIALQGVRRCAPQLGEIVVVSGLGLIGLLAVQLLHAAGVVVIGVEPLEARREAALQMGAEIAVAPGKEAIEAVKALSSGHGADAVIICAATPASSPLNEALAITRRKGRVVVVGAVGMDVDRADFYKKELDLLMSTSYGPGRYDPSYEEKGNDYPYGYVRWTERRNMAAFLDLLARDLIDTEPLVSDIYDIDQAPEAFASLTQGDADTIGLILDYGPEEGLESPKLYSAIEQPAPKINIVRDRGVGIALIGAGGFGRSVYLPLIADNPRCKLSAIVTAHGHNATRLADLYHADLAATDIHDALDSDKVDAVVIATRHNLHEKMALAALGAGKHVLLEKPMALTREGVDALANLAERSGLVFSVGHNRRYSPTARDLKRRLAGRVGPVSAQYRINAGSIPADHWTHDPEIGGGRIIGEMSHFVDLLSFLIGGLPVLGNAHAIATATRDNLSATLLYSDKSLAQIIYTSLGSKEFPKERLELNWDGTSAVLDDFRSLQIFGADNAEIDGEQQKGWAEQLDQFIAAIKGEPNHLSGVAEARAATLLTFEMHDRAWPRQIESERQEN